MTTTVTAPQPGNLYRFTLGMHPGGRDYLVFVIQAEVTEHAWAVRGYRVTSGYMLTEDEVTETGSIGRPDGVRHEAFCAPAGDRGEDQVPLYSDRFPASDTSLVRHAEIIGRAEFLG